MAAIRDHFSGHAAQYATARPGYPAALYDWIATRAPAQRLAWDCGTGNGQAAIGLARHFARVVATDASAAQIASAVARAHVEYRVAPAGNSGLPSAGADAVTVAQALHWFPLEAFYAEVRRVLRPQGLLVVWCYGVPSIAPALNALTQEFYRDVVGPYWPAERKFVEDGYRSLAFPFEPIAVPAFEMRQRWTLVRYLAYLRSWSATQRFIAARGFDPVDELATRLGTLWKTGARWVRWPLYLRAALHGR